VIKYLSYLAFGRLFIWFARKFPPVRDRVGEKNFLGELLSCNLCFGFWSYLLLKPFFKIDVDEIENRLVRNVLAAMLSSLLAVLIETGWQELFGTVVVDYGSGTSA